MARVNASVKTFAPLSIELKQLLCAFFHCPFFNASFVSGLENVPFLSAPLAATLFLGIDPPATLFAGFATDLGTFLLAIGPAMVKFSAFENALSFFKAPFFVVPVALVPSC